MKVLNFRSASGRLFNKNYLRAEEPAQRAMVLAAQAQRPEFDSQSFHHVKAEEEHGLQREL